MALRQSLAPDSDLGDSWHPQEPRTDLPVGDRRHLDQIDGLRRQPDLEDAAGGGEGRHDVDFLHCR